VGRIMDTIIKKRKNYYLLMILTGMFLYLEGKKLFVEHLIIGIINILCPLMDLRFEVVSAFIELVIIYGEIVILLLILSRWCSNKYDAWSGYRKSLYFYIGASIILEKIVLYLFYYVISSLLNTILGIVILTTMLKILIIFSIMLIICKISIKDKKQAFFKEKNIQKSFIIVVLITVCISIFAILGQWIGYTFTSANFNDLFNLMTGATPEYLIIDKWILPYLSRICAVLFLVDRN
jgi:hypothetical protein